MTSRGRSSPARSDGADAVVRIEKVVAEGDGLARLEDGRVVFVEGALPEETVRIRLTRQSRDYARAEISEILDPHPERREPPCRYVRRGCGGCDMQHASLGLQWRIKRDIVVESLERLGRIVDPQVRMVGVAAGDGPTAARTTVRVIGDPDGRPGFRRRRSHDVVPVDHCLVLHGRLDEMLPLLRLEPGCEAVLRCSASNAERLAVTDPSAQSSGVPPDAAGRTMIRETVGGVDFTISAGSFFQSSPGAAEDLVAAVKAALGDPSLWIPGPVVDAYGGVGLLSAAAVPAEREVVIVESSESSCGDAAVNLSGRRARIVCSVVEAWEPEPAAAVIADPPRDGLRAAAVDVLAATGTPILVLVSCDPASLGRDARLLEAAGYRFVDAQVLGAFPHTHHVETVSRFEKRP
ncbi:MAG: class I SAM-dependent RNA methyltransferase [Actinomycetota bacterium]